MLVAPRSATRTWPASARKPSWRGGRPPVLGPTSPSVTRPRSSSSWTRRATIARPSPVRSTSSERDRERPSRISSRTVTRSSRTSSGDAVAGSAPARGCVVPCADATPTRRNVRPTTFALDTREVCCGDATIIVSVVMRCGEDARVDRLATRLVSSGDPSRPSRPSDWSARPLDAATVRGHRRRRHRDGLHRHGPCRGAAPDRRGRARRAGQHPGAWRRPRGGPQRPSRVRESGRRSSRTTPSGSST